MRISNRLADWLRLTSKQKRRKAVRTTVAIAEALEDRRVLSANTVGSALGTGQEWIVSTTGDDWDAGSLEAPFQTIRRALDAAAPGDVITLRNGIYEGGINIDVDNLTIRSMPGEWAVIESPLTQQTDGHANSVLRYGFDVEGGKLENLEITGGYWYGVMFWDWWDSNTDAGSIHMGASNIVIDGCKIHDTGVDAVKITPGANDISILNSEIYNTGRRSSSSADGIDNNNGDRMIARGNYIHNISGIGILTSGGTEGSLIEQNIVKDTFGAGIVNGFYTELEWIEPDTNPGFYASIDTVVRNNIVVNAGQAGIGIYGALNGQVYNNTLVNPADDAQAPIQFGGYDMWISNSAPSYHHVSSQNVSVQNNVIVTNADNLTRMVDIREGSVSGGLTIDYNLYYGTSPRGVLFIDRNLTGDGTPEQTFSQWQTNYGYDLHSVIADPQLDPQWHLQANSPAIGKAIALAGLTTDFDGNPRSSADNLLPDLGADEFNAGVNTVLPPATFGAPSLEIASHGYHDYEGNTIDVKVVRHGSTSETITVQFATLDGSAISGSDFTAVAGTLTFLPGETEKIVSVPLLDDSEAEGDEHFLFTLSDPTTNGNYPVRLGHQHSASMTIDDEQTPITLNYATRWVSSEGSDVHGDGTEANPWHSLQFAADNVGPGDYVIVKPGNYWGFQVTTDGKADARITFHAMPGVHIDAPNPENNLDGINLEGADYVTIEGFNVANMPRAGLRAVLNKGTVFRENTSDHNGYWGILTGWSYDLLVENNIISRSQREHGIYISNSSDDGIIRNNIVWGNNDSGIQFNADGFLEGDGVHSRNIIEGNVVYDNGAGGGAALNLDGFQDGIVRNNLLYNNHATGIVLYVGFAAESSTNNLIQNNTVVMANDARWALLMWNGSQGNTIVNNILLNQNPDRGSITVDEGSLPARSDFNVIQDKFDLNGYTGNFSGWQTLTGGHDAHSIVVSQGNAVNFLNDLFVDPAAGDFHLKASSPAIDAGDSTDAPEVDLYQHPRPQGGGIDLGALEAGSFTPQFQFERSDVIGYEFIGMSEIAVTRTGDTTGPVAVHISATPGSATVGEDYQAFGGYLVFRPGETRKTFRVFVNDDLDIEERQTVNLSLRVVGDPTGLFPTDQVGDPTGLIPTDQVGDPTGLLPTDQATLHLVSDDRWQPGRFEFDSANVTVNEADGTATITVKRLGGSHGTTSVYYSTDIFTPAKKATWIKKHTDLLYPTDNDQPATFGDDLLASAGTLEFAAGETTKTITIPILNDDWFESGEAFLVKLADPTSGATLGQQSEIKVRIESDDAKQAGTFLFASPTYVVSEGNGSINVTINRLNGGNVEASVRLYETGAGNGSTTASAWAPSDYSSVPSQVTFAPGEMSKTITIPIVDDGSTEIDEVFSIQLYSPSNDALTGDISKTYVTIQDNESTFYFKGATSASYQFEGVEGSGKIPVTVVRQGALTSPASVTVSTGNGGSATAGVDFTPVNVTLNFLPGETSKTIDIPVTNDTLMEAKETIPVNMTSVIGATQGSWSWSAYITDDDVAASPGKFEWTSTGFSISENGGALNVTVLRTGGSDGTVTVQYRTLDGASGAPYSQTAYAGADYSSRNGTLTFEPGETSKVISIPITNDSSVEQDEFFTLELRNAAGGAMVGAINKAVVSILEDDSSIEFGTSSYTVDESAGFISIILTRKGSTSGNATVDLNISSGSAAAGQDFLKPASPTVTFASGQSTATVQISLIDDVFAEADEMFYLTLGNATGAKLGSSLWGNVKLKSNE